MKIVYSGAQSPNTIQSSSLTSLGGYYSSSVVPNDFFDNIFDYISRYGEEEKQDQYRCIVLINDGADPITNLEMWLTDDSVTPNSLLLLATMQVPANGKIEVLPSAFSRPYSVPEFFVSDVDNKLLVTVNMEPNEKIAIWIKREIIGQGNLFEGTPEEVKVKILALGKTEIKTLNLSWE